MRLELTRKTDLALKAITRLDRTGGLIKGADLAETIGTTTAFIAQVMKPLVAHGWVASEPGPTGGYRLATDTTQISVLDLIETVEGPTVDGRCVLRGTPCPVVEKCALHDAWNRARGALLKELSATRVSLIEEGVQV